MLIWLILPVALAYIPVPYQRRFLDGYYIPVGLVAAIGWIHWAPRRATTKVVAAVALGMLLSMTPLFRAAIQVERLTDWTHQDAALSEYEVAAIHWVGERCTAGEVVLIDKLYPRLLVPFLTPQCRSDAAHPHISIDFQQRYRAVNLFFSDTITQDEAEAVWRDFFNARTRYVIETNPNWVVPSFLKLVAQFGTTRVFTVSSAR